jgi:hypothetical protein
MSAIIRRFQKAGYTALMPVVDENKVWLFSPQLSLEDCARLVKQHLVHDIEYTIHRVQLAKDSLTKPDSELLPQLEDALVMAQVLEFIYRHYLNIPTEANRFAADQAIYRARLRDEKEYQFPHDLPDVVVKASKSKIIRQNTSTANLLRLLISRMRRLMVFTLPVAFEQGQAPQWWAMFDRAALPLLNYAAWVFFIPRMFTDLLMLAKHLLPSKRWMSQEEASLSWQTRFAAHLSRRWFFLGNDLAAMVVNALCCFTFVGAVASLGFYATIALLSYDVALASLRFYIEISRLKTLEKDYEALLKDKDMSADERAQIVSYLGHLHVRIRYEEKRLMSQILATALILMAFSLTFPVLGPLFPLFGAVMAILVTLAMYGLNRYFERNRPTDKVQARSLFFKPSPPPPADDKDVVEISPIAAMSSV